MHRLPPIRRTPVRPADAQRGVVLLFALIALVIMLIAAVAMVRSFQSSLFAAGNIGFKRDMRNQSEQAVTTALGFFRTNGGLDTTDLRANSVPNRNYSAVMLPTDAGGIPNALTLSNFATTYTAPDLLSQDAVQSVVVRYVIDRLCTTAGNEKTLSSTSCVLATNPTPAGSSLLNLQSAERAGLSSGGSPATQQGVVYRLSIMVKGPRNTQSFFQSTFTAPS